MNLKDYQFIDVHKMEDVPYRLVTFTFENEEKIKIYLTKEISRNRILTDFINSAAECKTLDKFIEKHGFDRIAVCKWIYKKEA